MIKFYKICKKYIVKGAAYACIRTCKAFFSSIPFFPSFMQPSKTSSLFLNVKILKRSQIFSKFLNFLLHSQRSTDFSARSKKRKDCLFRDSPWCEKRDLNPYGESTRPSNVRVYQFRHSRFSLTEGGIQAHPLRR